ncbi:S-layer homology domain-containing protein [Thermophilibacter mediterraneus]|uniref:S-layer homology domain-containing protein n=1 Tax=Thermophilibacter mediterraneus TaxID=1871031 RepID=UPI00092FE43F|nr:S-layer homology domain-containing protein [Thermophilibacter mediterraneus]
MTACTNNGGSRARRAVTAALVGVLSVGAAPMVALATGAPSGEVQLQAASTNEAIMAGTVDGYKVGIRDYKGNGPVSLSMSDVQSHNSTIVITSVKPGGVDTDSAAYSGSTYYYKKVTGAVDETTSVKFNGEWYQWLTDQTFANLTTGDYIAVIQNLTGVSYDAGESYNVPAVKFSVTADALDGAKVMKELKDLMGNVIGYSDELTWESGQDWDDLKIVLNDKVVTSADFAVYAKNQATGDLKHSEILPGTYEVVITGANAYDGEQVKYDVTVGKLNLSTLGLTIADVKGNTAPTFSDLYNQNQIVMDDKLGGVATDAILDFAISGTTWETSGLGEYTYTLSVKDGATVNGVNGQNNFKVSDLVEGTATIKFNRINASASSVTWTYDGKSFTGGNITVDASAAKDDLANGTLKSLDFSKFGGTYADITDPGTTGELAADQISYKIYDAEGKEVSAFGAKGTYKVVVEAVPSKLGWNVDRSALIFNVTVKQGTIGSANVIFTYDGDVKQGSVNVNYDAADYASRLGIQVTDSKGNALKEGTDYKVTIKNSKGDVVESAVDVDTYTVTVSSDTYELGGSVNGVESIDIRIDPLELTSANTRVTFPTAITYTTGSGAYEVEHMFIPYTGQDITPVIEVAYTTDEDGKPVWSTLDAALYDLTFGYDADLEGAFNGSSSRPETINKVGRYSVAFQIDPADTKNVFTSALVWDNNDSKGFTVTDKVKVFVDVPNTSYYAQPIYTAVSEGYIVGLGGSNMFGPDQSISRADMVCVLYRMAGGSVDSEGVSNADKAYISDFEDVDPNAYYAKAVAWAVKAGVANGYGDTFGTERAVSTEEFVTMLARYAAICGTDTSVDDVDAVLAGTPDGDQVSGYAREAMAWAVESEYVGKDGNSLVPQGSVSRGRAVTIAVRYQPEKATIVGSVE